MLTDYTGAGSRLDPERGLELDAKRWAWQPKIDGVYARVSLDRRGRVANVLARSGAPIREAADLLGLVVGAPDSVLHGELEAHTEAGNRAAAERGWRALHLFDCTRAGGRDVSARAYSDRYGELHRMQADLEIAGRNTPWLDDDQGDAHSTRNGRYCKRIPRDVRRTPIVRLHRGVGSGSALWREHVEIGGGEGVVAMALDAPAGKRGAKRKIKASDTLDVVIVAVDAGAVVAIWGGHTFAVSRGSHDVRVGETWEVRCDGMYESSVQPRFARLVRVRGDLAHSGIA